MPEGHVLHRLAHTITANFAGQPVTSTSPQGRFEAESKEITGRELDHAEAYGKHLFVSYVDFAPEVHIHLGMAGVFNFGFDPAPNPPDTVRWFLQTDNAWATLRGPAKCILVTPDERADAIAKLGPDPLRADADPDVAWQKIHRSTRTIAALLMDQAVTAGVGNIFRAEVLFRANIDPFLQGRFLRHPEWITIWDDLVELMEAAVDVGEIDTVRLEHTPEAMGRPPRVDAHGGEVYVYRRLGHDCYICGSPVKTEVLAGRNLFWCPTCQPRSRRTKPNA